jgi:uncharacterized protein (TIGR03083 family)
MDTNSVDYDQALVEENWAFGDVALAADLALPVPSCPGWSLLQLLRHVGRGDRWAAEMISQQADNEIDPRSVPNGRPPDDPESARTWLHEGAKLLVDTAGASDPDLPVWTFLGPRPARWWVRRRLHEATIHRADAAIATGEPYHLRAELAVDAIDEWLERLAIELRDAPPAIADGKTLRLEATDTDATWTVHGTPDGIECRHQGGPGAAELQLQGPVTGLLLALVRRRTPDQAGVRIGGDMDLWATWQDRTPL